MIIKSVIIEDENFSLNRLKKLLSNFEYINIVGEASDGKNAINIIEEKNLI
jgi:YesN/AraC family two-component response regulator